MPDHVPGPAMRNRLIDPRIAHTATAWRGEGRASSINCGRRIRPRLFRAAYALQCGVTYRVGQIERDPAPGTAPPGDAYIPQAEPPALWMASSNPCMTSRP